MKPRNKREREVAELSSKLPPIGEQHTEWAKEHVFPHIAYRSAGWLWCSDCGNVWMEDEEELVCNGEVKCPYCHRTLSITTSRKQKDIERAYMTIATIRRGYQVLRHVYCERWSRKRGTAHHVSEGSGYYFKEIVQEWISEDGKRTIMAKSMNINSTGWLYSSELSIKNTNSYLYDYSSNKYALCGEIYPKAEYLPILKKRGLKKDLFDCTPSTIITRLLEGNNDYEYLIKTKQISVLQHMVREGRYQLPHKHVINICNRNKYKVKDASLYFDYIDLLRYFRLDTHNAHYVCPKDLKKEHDKLLKRKQKILAEERRRANEDVKVKAAIKRRNDIKRFYENNLKFLGLIISDGNMTIQPLQSVTEFYKEWKIMKHCVFTNGYYAKSDCLILSAQINDKHIETVELNLKTFAIVQSRAVCNSNSEYHDQIIKLVNKNINLIKQAS